MLTSGHWHISAPWPKQWPLKSPGVLYETNDCLQSTTFLRNGAQNPSAKIIKNMMGGIFSYFSLGGIFTGGIFSSGIFSGGIITGGIFSGGIISWILVITPERNRHAATRARAGFIASRPTQIQGHLRISWKVFIFKTPCFKFLYEYSIWFLILLNRDSTFQNTGA